MTELERNRKILLRNLDSKKKFLISECNQLLHEYNLLKLNFKGTKSYEEAEMNYYAEQFSKSGFLEESRFSLTYNTSLLEEMEENKQKRIKLTNKITELKKEFKEKHNNHTLAFKRKKKIQQIKSEIK